MMSLLDLRRAVLDSQPAAVNRLARSLLAAFQREAGPGENWRPVARRHLHAMAAHALLEERALGEERAMAFVASTLAPLARLAPLYRGAGETDLAGLAGLVEGIGSERLADEARLHALGQAGNVLREAVSRARERGGTASPGPGPADREVKAALRRLLSVAAPALRFELALDASRFIASQAARLPLSTLAHTPYEEMLVRELDLLQGLVAAYLDERWFRNGRYVTLFSTIPAEVLAPVGRAVRETGDDRLLRATASAILVPALDRLDQLERGDLDADAFATVAETGRRLADWIERMIAADTSLTSQDPRRIGLDRLRSSHGPSMDALLLDLRGRCFDADRSE
ncbi:hypothetical protein [Aquibium microcysteis]|uniref:hypothetical protein n=1 Tax=Aquibium microcysteis TaxID=675281 RepID=UPI00165D0B47|nr:hypothetical protein [Aquibium microcysteis]